MHLKPPIDSRLDAADLRILSVLATEGRIAVTELANRVGLSKTPCQTRMKRLRDEGYIQGFRAILDPARLGLAHVAFVEVKMDDTREPALRAFNEAARMVPEIAECHMIAGAFDYLLKIRSNDINDYRRVLGEVISRLPHVAATSTHVSMEAVKEENGLS